MPTAIEVNGLTRSYAQKQRRLRPAPTETVALRGIDLEVGQGEVRGLLGPNGAGKTTLVKILSTVLLPTSGRAQVLGHDVATQADRIRSHIGIVFGGERGLYGRLTTRENLDYWAALYGATGRRRSELVARLLDRVGLGDRGDMQVDRLSRGMKQRLHLARGLVGGPEVLFLDEPTVGMDPVSAREFRTLVGDLRAEGLTILVTTHDMREAEAVCDRVTLIDRGQVVGTEAPSEVGRWISAYERVDARDVPASLKERLRGIKGVSRVEELANGWTRFATQEPAAVRSVLTALVEGEVTAVRTSLPSLEDVYLEVVGNRGLTV
ncbi:ABC transporter ATP-binding protein [Streptomyces sp. CoT10]|uniref:ABC transporter ATP-binding protein n=1 Tax=Streptomyces sp. CoT10 TaxID=2875762 RepID=UPI001CD3DBE4|nr:ABC transporter ATP-binding protein [Streptomyces sp. CoT10]